MQPSYDWNFFLKITLRRFSQLTDVGTQQNVRYPFVQANKMISIFYLVRQVRFKPTLQTNLGPRGYAGFYNQQGPTKISRRVYGNTKRFDKIDVRVWNSADCCINNSNSPTP